MSYRVRSRVETSHKLSLVEVLTKGLYVLYSLYYGEHWYSYELYYNDTWLHSFMTTHKATNYIHNHETEQHTPETC